LVISQFTKSMTNERSRGWCWTINNPTGWDSTDLESLIEKAQYVCYGKETGEEGTPHFQGFCYFKERKSFKQLKEILPRAHIERQRGPTKNAVEYCQKDGDFHEWGTRPTGPGGQGDKWKQILKLSREGEFEQIEEEYPSIYFRYHSKLQGFFKPKHPTILDSLENEWWVGATGTGKSRKLWIDYPEHYQKSLNKWWDGYDGQAIVAIEEWSPKNEVTSSLLKIWADRYPFSAEIKGGTLQKIRPKKVIVLSNYTIQECFVNNQDLDPILRRFKQIRFSSLSA